MNLNTRYQAVSAAFLLTVFSLNAMNPQTALAGTVGAIPGQFAVSESGAATYTIPIEVPPGTAGMEPKLSLSYNSQGGNGLLGIGWSLSGLSAITRCPRTIVQDGANAGVDYTSNDKYCLDGQRLVAITGTYGADNTEYRTEMESFAKIISYSTAGNGPAWFKVWTKSGQIMEFGNTTDSRIEAQGKTTVAVWGVNKISDTKGNYLTVTYTEDNANGQFYPNRIDYTGNSSKGLMANNSVQLQYETRPDINPQYIGGSLINLTNRLKSISLYTGSTSVYVYTLNFENSAAPNNSSRLVSLTNCAGSVCLPATEFDWKLPVAGDGFSTSKWSFTGYYMAPGYIGDFNGDGRGDMIYISVNNKIYIKHSNGSDFGVALDTGYTYNKYGCESGQCPVELKIGDLNGDGKDDIIFPEYLVNSKYNTLVSTGTGFSASKWSFTVDGYIGDFNGDGRGDLAYVSQWNNKIYIKYSNGSDFGVAVDTGYTYNKYGCESGQCPVELKIGDLNGDGKDDIIFPEYLVNSKYNTLVSTGTGFSASKWSFTVDGYISDFNGDGRGDLAYVSQWNNKIYIKYSNGSDFGVAVDTGYTYNKYGCELGQCPVELKIGDLNGDGKDDVIFPENLIDSKYNALLPAPRDVDHITTITKGNFNSIDIDYVSLLDDSIYSPESNAIYPVRDLNIEMPIYVVSSSSSDNGVGGKTVSSYVYAGAKSHLTGRGFLGFHVVESTNQQTGLVSQTVYRQDHPYIGLPVLSEKSHNGTLLNRVTTTYGLITAGTGASLRNFPYAQQSDEESYDLGGNLITRTTTTQQFDSYGNPTQIIVNSNDGYSKTTVNTYNTADTTNWILGRLKRATVTSTTP